MNDISNISDYINKKIAEIPYPAQPSNLYEPIRYTLDSGGKRLRPTLLLSVMAALGADIEKGISQALGIEMFHNFTLLHDDIMDNADVRRGRPTVHRKWDDNTAILSGDCMLSMATLMVADCDASHLSDIIGLFNKTAIEVYEGQQYDMDFESRNDVTIDEYMYMIRLKTSVLLACACKMGAILADAPADTAQAFYQYGISLGLAFQLQDDRLDTYGDPLIFGKQIGGDIINNKKTWLSITASSEDETGTMAHALKGDYDSREKIARVKEVYNSLDLENRIGTLIADYADRAVLALEGVDIRPDWREYFVSMARKLNDRSN